MNYCGLCARRASIVCVWLCATAGRGHKQWASLKTNQCARTRAIETRNCSTTACIIQARYGTTVHYTTLYNIVIKRNARTDYWLFCLSVDVRRVPCTFLLLFLLFATTYSRAHISFFGPALFVLLGFVFFRLSPPLCAVCLACCLRPMPDWNIMYNKYRECCGIYYVCALVPCATRPKSVL